MACEADSPPGSEVQELFNDLSDVFDIIWPLIITNGKSCNLHHVASRLARRSGIWLPATMVEPGNTRVAIGVLRSADDPLRQALSQMEKLRRLQTALGGLSARQARESQYLAMRQRDIEQQARPTGDSAGALPAVQSGVRSQISSAIGMLETEVMLRNERATQPLGELSSFMRALIEPLRVADLDVEQGPTTVKLSLHAAHLAKINRQVSQQLNERLQDDAQQVETSLQTLVDDARTKFRGANGSANLALPPLDERRHWQEVQNLIAVGEESHIELRRRGIFDVLTAGRQKVFILIMFASLAGRMGLSQGVLDSLGLGAYAGFLHTGFGVLLLSVFIGSMISAVFTWQHEKQTQSEKEMRKIKDSLYDDGCKVIEQVQKTRLALLKSYLKDAGKRLEDQVDQCVREALEERKRETEAQRVRLDRALQSLDARTKEVSEWGRQIARLQQSSQELIAACRSVMQELAQRSEMLSTDMPANGDSTLAPAAHLANQGPAPAPAPGGGRRSRTPDGKLNSGFAERRAARKRGQTGT